MKLGRWIVSALVVLLVVYAASKVDWRSAGATLRRAALAPLVAAIVINIVSVAGLRPQPGGLLYSFTKAGLIMMTRSWAQEFGQYNIRVNAIAPGLVQTDFSAYFWKDEARRRHFESTQPIHRIGQPEEIGGMALYLASEEASFVTGQVMVVDGGLTAV